MTTETTPPRTVYHGTDRTFDGFDTSRCLGVHFGTFKAAKDRLRSTGRLYIEMNAHQDDQGRWWALEEGNPQANRIEHGPFDDEDAALNVVDMNSTQERRPLEFEIDVYKPLQTPDLGTWNFEAVFNHLCRGTEILDAHRPDLVWNEWMRSSIAGWTALKEALAQAGFDSIAYQNETEDPGSISWIVLDASAIHLKWTAAQREMAAELLERQEQQTAHQDFNNMAPEDIADEHWERERMLA